MLKQGCGEHFGSTDLRSDSKVEIDTREIKFTRYRMFPKIRASTRLSFTLGDNSELAERAYRLF